MLISKSQTQLLDRIKIVLVNTSHPGNIGATARAMTNMGLSKLALVQPMEYPSMQATARAAGADDVLLVDTAGHLLESAVANVWVIRDGVARTPPAPARCLPGVMREWLLRHLEGTGICARECDLSLSDIDQADELWLSNAVVGLRRVRSILDRKWESWQPISPRIRSTRWPTRSR